MVQEQLQQLGYRVEPSQHEDNPNAETVYFVDGFGIMLYVGADDSETWEKLLNNHAQRVETLEDQANQP